jgi:hypothetical protein
MITWLSYVGVIPGKAVWLLLIMLWMIFFIDWDTSSETDEKEQKKLHKKTQRIGDNPGGI